MNPETPPESFKDKLKRAVSVMTERHLCAPDKAKEMIAQKLHKLDGKPYSKKQIYNWLNETSTPPSEHYISDQLDILLQAQAPELNEPKTDEPKQIEDFLFQRWFDYGKMYRELKRENIQLRTAQEELRLRVEELEELNNFLKHFYRNKQ